ncbi:conserved membrane hypothetical protein [Vibrio crassostreae]|nr:conserved membrane hypothetical protein [Vibrio crassostreae]CAK3107845.1 conserved membrane hypothetical protein [Vibrio crassostreae]CAK3175899.1 conserved membrane hypothetical protein [Vibrio crassostreae]CAK3197394.1 conserved membrane hypothetical protein [Vibrio crassostreae]CAK3210902.1 conserved membrane hypothetical protein [Vibrio crassostreae]
MHIMKYNLVQLTTINKKGYILSDHSPQLPQSQFSFMAPIYIITYTLFSIWLLMDGWINNFASIYFLWSSEFLPLHVQNLIFTMLGALLGCAVLGITSFHRYKAIDKIFDGDHLWGFFLAPFLALIVGILIFALLQSGLVVLTNQSVTANTAPSDITASLGYLAIGGISGYNWDVFVNKLEELSANVMSTPSQETSKKEESESIESGNGNSK